jgi:phosphoribosyl-dephospho-CoA transferase
MKNVTKQECIDLGFTEVNQYDLSYHLGYDRYLILSNISTEREMLFLAHQNSDGYRRECFIIDSNAYQCSRPITKEYLTQIISLF